MSYQVEKERLMKSFQEVVQASKDAFDDSAHRVGHRVGPSR